MQYLITIQTFIAAIKAVEVLMPTSPGKEKLDVALSIVSGVVGDITPIAPALTAIATTVVNALKATGQFKSSTPTTSAN